MSTRLLVKIVTNYCEKNNISLRTLSSDWILKLTNNQKIRYIYGYQFDLNSSGVLSICNDKSAASLILNDLGIPNVCHELIMPPLCKEKIDFATDFFYSNNEKIVCKINNGTGGKDVYLISSLNELLDKMHYLLDKELYIALSPYYDITNEYRVIILNDEIKLIYSKERRNSWKHNLGLGAEPVITEDKNVRSVLSKLALNACHAVGGKFIAVDIIEVDGEYKVLEINSGIMMENFASKSDANYEIAEKIYGDAVSLMFN